MGKHCSMQVQVWALKTKVTLAISGCLGWTVKVKDDK
jgi:hypothetical protein